MWEVDPETKSKLLALQKLSGNDRCCDCPAASPQWASPKFGTFICLECAGRHRGLGVHISFVRSITMDAFKGAEMARMDLGGNNAWRTFWEEQRRVGESVWDETSLEERYGGEVGEEWKERLACKVEGREYMGLPARPKKSSTMTPTRTESPLRTASPGMSAGLRRKEQNEAFFARKGGENVNRPADLPPSQGGKYAGFGSEPPALSSAPDRGAGDGGSMPGVVEFQKDPVAALTKGLGWFTTTVGRGAKTVNDGWIQPTAQKIAQTDLSSQARLTASSLAQNIQSGTKGAAEQLSKLIDGPTPTPIPGASTGRSAVSGKVEPERRDFWDSFGEERTEAAKGRGSSAIGTVAVKKPGTGTGSGAAPGGKDEGWEEW